MKADASNMWKGIVEAMPFLRKATRWNPRNGRRTKFWEDAWLFPEPLSMHSTRAINAEEKASCVADYWHPTRGWKWEVITNFLPNYVLECMEAHMLVEDKEANDHVCWIEESSGTFSVSSAYNTIYNNIAELVSGGTCERIWKVKTTSRAKVFLWLTNHKKIMSYVERKKRGFMTNEMCHICSQTLEDADHILFRCPIAVEAWRGLALGRAAGHKWGKPFHQWKEENICSKDTEGDLGN